VGGWIAATTRNECLRVLRATGRVVLVDGSALEHLDTGDGGIDTGLLVYERDRAVLEAFSRLGARCQRLLRLMVADPAPTYDEIAAALDMPVGSIGPTRARCLSYLRRELAEMGFLANRERDQGRGGASDTDRGRTRGKDRKG
jgi:DNA-directed RNA polymerase specialized sigma24 family protein